jgi:5-methyltetrahydropteroyltriglutamate--homocysteine methyltransferase
VGQWSGVDTQHLARTTLYRNRVVDRLVPRVSGKVLHRTTTSADEVRFAKNNTRLPLKVAVPGPMTVVDSTVNEFYSDEAEEAMDIASAINIELLQLQAAGCDVLQIDEPAMTRHHAKVKSYGVKALDRCLVGIHVPTVVHLCYGYPGGVSLQHQYGYADLLPTLMQSAISGFTVEFGRSDFDVGVLSECTGRIVMFGCVDPGDSPAPSLRSVVKKVEEALKFVEPANMWLSPDCGLMTINRQLAQEKIRVMVQAADLLRPAK